MKILSIVLSCFFCSFVQAQSITISGYILDETSGEKLIGANIYIVESNTGVFSNSYGFYSFQKEKNEITKIVASYIGYKNDTLNLNIQQDTTINILLTHALNLEQVEVVSKRTENTQTQMSKIILPIKEIKKVSPFLGEPDLFRVLQLLPGIQSGAEGLTGLYDSHPLQKARQQFVRFDSFCG